MFRSMRGLSLILVVPAAAVALCGAVSADPSSYLQTLDDRGVTYESNREAILWGDEVCVDLRGGVTLRAIRDGMLAKGFTGSQAGSIVRAAVFELCPDQLGNVSQQALELRRRHGGPGPLPVPADSFDSSIFV